MIPYKQLVNHDPDNNSFGDCFRTAIACVLEILPEKVPHVFEQGVTDQEGCDKMREWLGQRGLSLVEVPMDYTLQVVLDWAARQIPDGHYLLSGKSDAGCGHMVVCKGNQIVHDPAMRENPIVGPLDGRLYWVGIIAKVLP